MDRLVSLSFGIPAKWFKALQLIYIHPLASKRPVNLSSTMYSYHQFKQLFHVRCTIVVVYCRLVEIPHTKKSMGASDWRRTLVFHNWSWPTVILFPSMRFGKLLSPSAIGTTPSSKCECFGNGINADSSTTSVANAELERQMTSWLWQSKNCRLECSWQKR